MRLLKGLVPALSFLGVTGPMMAEKVADSAAAIIYRTDEAINVDGEMKEACWEQAKVISEFLPISGSEGSQKTEVRFVYDAKGLSCFWKVYESSPGKVPSGADRGDAVEVELRPYNEENQFIIFGGTPDGRTYILPEEDAEPSRRWKGKAGRFEGGWTFEASIPLEALAETGRFLGTPQQGKTWGLNLYRKRQNASEIYAWKPTGAQAVKTECTFAGFPAKDGPEIPAHIAVDFPFSVRSGAAKIIVEKSFRKLAISNTVSQNDSAIEKTESELEAASEQDIKDAIARATHATQTVEMPFRLAKPGLYHFRYDLTQEDRLIYRGWAVTEVSSEKDLLPDTSGVTKEFRNRLAKSDSAESRAVLAKLQELEREVDAARRSLDREGELAREEQLRLIELCRTFPGRWAKLKFELNLARILMENPSVEKSPFAVGTARSDEKIYRDSLYHGEVESPITLNLAGNETGATQLVVLPFWKDAKDVSVSVSALTGPDGKEISPDRVKFFEVNYVTLEDPPSWAKLNYQRREEPDPLVPLQKISVEAGKVGVIWMDVEMPEALPTGAYKGTLTVTSGEQSVVKEVVVKARGFDLPRKGSLKTDFWFVPYENWKPHYGEFRYTPEMHARHARELARYRIGSFPVDWTALCPQVPIYREENGTFTFDWSVFDQFVKNAADNHATAYWVSLSSCAGWTSYLNNSETKFTDRASGKVLRVGDIMRETWEKNDEQDENSRMYGKSYRENPIYRDFLVAYEKHLGELGILDRSYYEQFDEANQDRPPHRLWHWMVDHHGFFRETVPNLELLNFGVTPLQNIDEKNPLGLIDAWAPHLFELDEPGLKEAIEKRRKDHGEEFWSYTCVQKMKPGGKKTPYIYYHEPYIGVRMHFWIAWKYGLDGLLIYSLNRVPKSNLEKSPETRWPKGPWSDGGNMGEGVMIYPGENFEIIPSIRISQIRKGLEDYEYFALLKRETAKLDAGKHKSLIEEVSKAMLVEDDIVKSVYEWTEDQNLLEEKKEKIAALVTRVQAELAKSEN